MNTLEKEQLFNAQAQITSEFLINLSKAVKISVEEGMATPNQDLQSQLQHIPKMFQQLVDIDTQNGYDFLYREYEHYMTGTIKTFLGDFICLHLNEIYNYSPDKASAYHDNIIEDFSTHTDSYNLKNIRAVNIRRIVDLRVEQGWSEDEIISLKRELTTPTKWDNDSQIIAKKNIQDFFFPDEVKPVLPTPDEIRYIPYQFMDLFQKEDGTVCEQDIMIEPLISLYHDGLIAALFDNEKQYRQTLLLNHLEPFSEALYSMYETNPDFTLTFLTGVLRDKTTPDFPTAEGFLVADFVEQQINYQHEEYNITREMYENIKEITRPYLNNLDNDVQVKISYTNLQAAISPYYKRANKELYITFNELEQHFTPCHGDSPAQIGAKRFVLENNIKDEFKVCLKPPSP